MPEPTEPNLMPVDILGFRVLVARGDAEALLRTAAMAAVALHDRPQILTQLDAVERERARLRQLVLAAGQACQTALNELGPKESA